MSENGEILICSVGGTAEPIRKTIDFHKPQYVLYIASSKSGETIKKEIEDKLDWKGVVFSQILTLANYQDLLNCVTDIRAGVDKFLKDRNLPADTHLIADITGGTKVMSAALTLAMMEYNSSFSYVGAKNDNSRDKGGQGVVKDGEEVVMLQDNPWEAINIREIRNLANAFNEGQFTTALQIIDELIEKVKDNRGKSKFYGALREVIKAYSAWDAFDHKSARQTLDGALKRLEPYTLGLKRLEEQLKPLQKQLDILNNVYNDAAILRSSEHKKKNSNEPKTLPPDCGKAYLRDLLANAKRRAKAGHYDDAVARLYSAIEKSAKIELMVSHGIDNSNVDLENENLKNLPEDIHKELIPAGTDKIKLPLQKSFFLLDALHNSLGAKFRVREKH